MPERFPCVGKVMALANAADNGQWDEVQRLLRAGPRLSQSAPRPQLPYSNWSVLKLVLGLVEHNREGNCQRGGSTPTAMSTHYGSAASAQQRSPNCLSSLPKSLLVENSGPTGIGVETVLRGLSRPTPIAPPLGADVNEKASDGLWLSATQCPFWGAHALEIRCSFECNGQQEGRS